jgi:hypothetical protein
MTLVDIIISAIHKKVSLQIVHQAYTKLVSPVRIGWKTTKKQGRHMNVLVYQFGGYSAHGLQADGSMDNYRCLDVSEITSALAIGGPWHGGYGLPTERSACVDDVIAGPPI